MENNIKEIWQAGVNAVGSKQLIRNQVHIEDDRLFIAGELIPLADPGKIVVVGAGKAGAGMAEAIEEIFIEAPKVWNQLSGWVNVPDDCVMNLKKIHLHGARPAGLNEPVEAGVVGTKFILELIEPLGENDLCIVLLSGGGSALLPAPVEGISLEDKREITQKLSAAGAPIQDLNTVRKHLSRVKGGRLAQATNAGHVISLIISDVIGDPLDIIASGPTYPDDSTALQALEILNHYLSSDEIPESIIQYLRTKTNSPENQKPIGFLDRVSNHIIGNNQVALDASEKKATELGYHVISFGSNNTGIAREVGSELAEKCLEFRDEKRDQLPICLLSGGEPTVELTQDQPVGQGGRNQELVLSALKRLQNENTDGILILSGGTDGEDGPTDAAGAWMSSETIERVKELNLNPDDYLNNNNSYFFFQQTGGLLMTGPTNTNVMDVRVALIESVRDH